MGVVFHGSGKRGPFIPGESAATVFKDYCGSVETRKNTHESASVQLCSHPELDDRIVIVRVADEVDAVFVRTEKFDVLIDTLGTPEECAEALDLLRGKETERPLIVVNSHMDWDHFWGNSAIAGRAPIIAHAVALERLRDPAAQRILREKAGKDARFRNVELISPTLTFSGSTVLHGGDLTLELIHTPGHTPDHIAVWIPEVRVCLAVDAVEKPIPKVWSDDPRDLRSICSSLEGIRALSARLVIPAHGQTSSPSLVDENLAYFRTLAERVGALSPRALKQPELSKMEGLRLQDFVSIPDNMGADAIAFYERFHQANLRATIRACIEG